MRTTVAWLSAALLFVGACKGHEVEDSPAIASPTGIPMGAPGATGVRFGPNGTPGVDDAPTPAPGPELGVPHGHPLPKQIPDPFNPHEGPTPPPKKKGTTL